MFELMAIRTLLSLQVLEKIPEGSISLRDLSAATGVQESLLGTLIPAISKFGNWGLTRYQNVFFVLLSEPDS